MAEQRLKGRPGAAPGRQSGKMAENETPEAQAPEAAKSGGILPWIIVGVVASGLGAVVPVVGMAMMNKPVEKEKPAPFDATPSPSALTFMPYGEVTVNLDEGRMNRYLRIKIVLHVRKADTELITKAISGNELILRNWLISHLSDKALEDIRGKAGQNMLRREIRDHFNMTLFPDGYERIYDILFEEFNVQ